ncbi:MAG: 4-(cytidine 5'-diphospho)-2-C-methyl-D-erythritol kinase [Paracoccaceae bacterium]|nr:4-(cytidine 5'-diphospho)-2-C-methyl-D-erythritol kinase [Paracoccaceae bacterium]
MPRIETLAPAKINLTLHVTGQRADGYHLLDSLVTFAPVGDRLLIGPGAGLSLMVDGPEAAGVPADASNLVLKMAALLPAGHGATLRLRKYLPAASGIGGGSSDAAAALRGLAAFWGLVATDLPAPDRLAALGADIPMCMMPEPLRARGIGADLTPVSLPPLPAILVNPRVEVPTPAVFKALTQKQNPPMPAQLPPFADAPALISWLERQRNDLQAPACAVQPIIATVLETLQTLPGARLARMSGSGATCFALFTTMAEAEAAHHTLCATCPAWWSTCALLGDQRAAAAPQAV